MKRFQHKIVQGLDQGKRALFVRYGAGKTRALIHYFKLLAQRSDTPLNFCVHTPRKVLKDWYTEIRSQWPEAIVIPYDTFNEEDTPMIPLASLGHHRVILVRHRVDRTKGYNRNVRDARGLLLKYAAQVLDESTIIKNPKTDIFGSMQKWARLGQQNGTHNLIATGEPSPEGPHEFWAQFEFCYPGHNPLGYTYYTHLTRWFVHTDYGYVLRHDLQKEFYAIIDKYSVRLDVEDFEEFYASVPKVEARGVISYTPSVDQVNHIERLYKSWDIEAGSHTAIDDNGTGNATWYTDEFKFATELLTKEMQICSGFFYSTYGKVRLENYLTDQPKALALCEHLNNQIGQGRKRIAVWHTFVAEEKILVDYLAHRCNLRGLPVLAINEKNIGDILERGSDWPCVLIVSSSYGRGVNHFRDTPLAYIYSNSFSQEIRDQLESRHVRLSSNAGSISYYDLANQELADGYCLASLQAKAMSPERALQIARFRRQQIIEKEPVNA